MDAAGAKSLVLPLLGAASSTVQTNDALYEGQRTLKECRLINATAGIALGIHDFAARRRNLREIGVVQWDQEIAGMFKVPEGSRAARAAEVAYRAYAEQVKQAFKKGLAGEKRPRAISKAAAAPSSTFADFPVTESHSAAGDDESCRFDRRAARARRRPRHFRDARRRDQSRSDRGGRRRGLPFVLAHTETAGALMAAAQAEITGAPGVCLATLGPGVASLVNGVAHAWLDRVPLVVLTDAMPAAARRSFEHQNLPHGSMLGAITRFSGNFQPPAPTRS